MWHRERGESRLTFSVLLGILTGVIAIGAFITGRTTIGGYLCSSPEYVSISSSSDNLLLRDDGSLLNQPAVAKAAESLTTRGALVAIYTFSPETAVYDRVEQDKRFKDLLELDNLTSNPNMISIYLTCYNDGRYSWVTRYGSNWSSSLNARWDEISSLATTVNRDKGYTTTITSQLYAIDRAISGKPMIAPTEIPAPTTQATRSP